MIGSDNFQLALKAVFQYEGVYSNDPDDTGGETYRGISRRFHSSWPGWVIIDKMKCDGKKISSDYTQELEDHAAVFYYSMWNDLMLDRCPDRGLAVKIYQQATLMGMGWTVAAVQRALNIYCGAGLAEDGRMGLVTMGAVVSACNAGKGKSIARSIACAQVVHHEGRVIGDASQRKWIIGWTNRAWSDV